MPTFGAGENGLALSTGAYDPKIGAEVDREIRHMPQVVDHLMKKANELLEMVNNGSVDAHGRAHDAHGKFTSRAKVDANFKIILSNESENTRARAYVAPASNGGIHLELADAVLLKAALNMEGR